MTAEPLAVEIERRMRNVTYHSGAGYTVEGDGNIPVWHAVAVAVELVERERARTARPPALRG